MLAQEHTEGVDVSGDVDREVVALDSAADAPVSAPGFSRIDMVRRFVAVAAGLDLLLLVVVVGVVAMGTEGVVGGARAASVLVAVWFALLGATGAYSRRDFGAGAEEFRAVALSSVFCLGLTGTSAFLLDLPFPRLMLLLAFVAATPLLLVQRYCIRLATHAVRRNGRMMHRVIAVGGPSGIDEVIGALSRNRHLGYEVIGVCLPDGVVVSADRLPAPLLGRVEDTRRLCEETGADTVLVTRGGFASASELRRVAWELEGSDIDLVVVPSLTDIAGSRVHIRPVAGLPLLHVEQPQSGRAGGWYKRAFDVAVATAALVALSPLLLVVALLVKLHDGGPVVFRQLRVGRDGEPFMMVKFRSMVTDAELRLDDLIGANESDGLLFKIRQDPRITPIGRFLRRYSLDELPQLINVLRGDMSLVGPRPPLPSEVDLYAPDVHRRLLVRPGLTGLWQVSGRSELSWDESVRLDLFYVDNWSMTRDLVIVAKTVRAVLTSSGAY